MVSPQPRNKTGRYQVFGVEAVTGGSELEGPPKDGTCLVCLRRAVVRGALCLFLTLIMAVGCTKGPAKGSLSVDSTPESGAKVYLNSDERGVTPLVLNNLDPGAYVLKLDKPGHRSSLTTVQVKAGQTTKVTQKLEIVSGVLVLTSDPSAVEVFLDDEHLGVTPIQADVAVGKHHLRATKPNFEEYSADIEIPEGSRMLQLKIELHGRPGTLVVRSNPDKADVYINEEKRGRKTPSTTKVNAGRYIVAVELPGYERQEKEASVIFDQETVVEFELQPGYLPRGMVKVLAGEFIMGSRGESADEEPERKVYVDTFYIDKYEVTNDMYKQYFPAHTFPSELGSYPIAGVSWNDASAFVMAAGKRLPTEAEWEKAARGTDGRIYPWGNDFRPECANVKITAVVKLMMAGQFSDGISPYGCYDMAGNVWEWVEDWYNPYPGNRKMDKDFGQRFRVLRGGAFDAEPYHARCANRQYDVAESRQLSYGFRCAMSLRQ